MFKPLVSVIVPIYNAEKYLVKCIESICNQYYQNLEIILVNDGSIDNSAMIIREYEKNDIRIKTIDQLNSGVSVARNHGLEVANGDYILFVDSDDWIEKNMIEVLVDNILLSNADISCCQYDKMVSSNITQFEIWDKEKTLKEFIIHKNINGSLGNKLIKRNILKDIFFDSRIKYGEDALFCWQCFINISSLCITDRVLYHGTMHNDSASGGGSYKPIRRDCIFVWKKIADSAAVLSKKLNVMAKAQLANMAFYSLYAMYYYDYCNDADEASFIKELKSGLHYLNKAHFIPLKVKISAFFLTMQNNFGRELIKIFIKKGRKK